jgi:hypothetical protein
MKKVIFILWLVVISVPVMGQTGEPMDKTVDRFYVNHRHPQIRQGASLLGTIILQNNNPDGFSLKLVSLNGGKLAVGASTLDGGSDILYYITFEEGSGRVGTGVEKKYSSAEMITDHFIYQTDSQDTSTDVALKVYLNIDHEISDLLMAGKYRDEIELIYTNHNPL